MEAEVHGSSRGRAGDGRVLPGIAARKRAAVELIRSHGALLRSTARRYSICADDADDAYQRGLEILLRKAPTSDPRQLLPWSRTVIKREALAVRKERERILGRPAVGVVTEEEQDWVQLIPSEGDGPEERVAGRERVARSREALARLKPNELRALTQLAQGYSYAEIAAMNNWTRTKVNRCLAEGRQRFRSAFRQSEQGERCTEVEPFLSACCDGELEPDRLKEVEDHLAACGGCRATLRTYRAAPKAAVALAPALPVSRGLWERLQEAAVSIHGKLTGIADPSGVGVGTAGAARGVLPAAVVKVAAVCAGTAGTAAICVATGVLPAPVINHQPDRQPDRPVREEKTGVRPEPPVYAVPPAGPAVPSPAGNRGGDRAGSQPNRGRPETAGPPPAPSPTPTEAEFTPEAAGTPVQAAPPPPPPAVPAAGTGGGGGPVPVGGGGEFGP